MITRKHKQTYFYRTNAFFIFENLFVTQTFIVNANVTLYTFREQHLFLIYHFTHNGKCLTKLGHEQFFFMTGDALI